VNAPGTYSVTVTDDKGCVGTGSTTIATLLPSPSGFMQADTSICEYSSLVLQSLQNFSSYNWSTGSVTKSITITQAGQYWLEVRDNNDCVGKEFITVVPKQCMKGLFVPSAFTPNNDGKNDLIKPIAYGNLVSYKFSIFNRWGQVVFQSSDAGQQGWNGIFKGIPQPSDTFIWTCSYQFQGEQPQLVNGSFVLIR
jgi:gliding motility-associated-like protein